MFYFSVVTATTLGYGDIAPVRKDARAVTTVQTVFSVVLIGLFLDAVGQRTDSGVRRQTDRALAARSRRRRGPIQRRRRSVRASARRPRPWPDAGTNAGAVARQTIRTSRCPSLPRAERGRLPQPARTMAAQSSKGGVEACGRMEQGRIIAGVVEIGVRDAETRCLNIQGCGERPSGLDDPVHAVRTAPPAARVIYCERAARSRPEVAWPLEDRRVLVG